MPTAADKLSPGAGEEEKSAAISACISQLADEHPEWSNEKRVAACHSMAESATGQAPSTGVGKKTTRRIIG